MITGANRLIRRAYTTGAKILEKGLHPSVFQGMIGNDNQSASRCQTLKGIR
jgi:hypothetical protein